MGGFKLPTRTARLIFEDEDYRGAEVVAKFNLPIGRVIAAQDIATTGNIKELCQTVADLLVSWNLEDDEGKPIPATYEGVKAISTEFLLMLLQAWAGAQVGPSKNSEAPSTSGSPSVEESIPMETSSASQPS
jgi:hypothetical protein